jgi:CBS domain-containing protein
MTAPAITVERWQSAAHAATMLTRHRIKRLPVLDRGKLVGILTRGDLVRAFARSDAEIEREIRERVVVRDFWQLPEDIDISVDGGKVTLSGVVDGPISVEALPEAVQSVPGVVSVTSTLAPRGRQPSARRHGRRS